MALVTFFWTRFVRAYSTLPGFWGWVYAAFLFAVFAAIALPTGLATGFLKFEAMRDTPGQFIVFAAIAFVVPSLLEETLYRGLLLPHPLEEASFTSTAWQTILSVTLFVVGHPLVAIWVPSAQEMFFDPRFLALTFVFGIASSLAYLRTGSIWPSVLMHWGLILAWKVRFGGWIMAFGPKPL